MAGGVVKDVARQLLVLGGGYCGRRFAAAAAARGVPVLISRRAGPPVRTGSRDGNPTWTWIGFEGSGGILPKASDLAGTTHVLSTIPPDARGEDPVLSYLLPVLESLPLRWFGYLSTTGVYGDRGGAWVRESDEPRPLLPRSQARLRCEKAWLDSGLPVQVFRLPAIYGPHRTPFRSLLEGSARLIHKPGQVFSRVHVDDIVGGLLHCLALAAEQRSPPVVNLADDYPCPSSETLGFAAHLLGCRLPEMERYERIADSLSPMAQSFWSENRRAANRLLCRELGYRLRHPTFREGYRASLDEEREGSSAGLPLLVRGTDGRGIGREILQGRDPHVAHEAAAIDRDPASLQACAQPEHEQADQQPAKHDDQGR
jgi:nucleoside-diphosphate-sugar epimerase